MRPLAMLIRNAIAALAAVSALTFAVPALAQSEEPVQPTEPAPNLMPPAPDSVPSPDAQVPPEGVEGDGQYDGSGDQAEADGYDDEQPTPPPPVEEQQAPPPVQVTVNAAPAFDGQWVFTGQYGWVWMPYAQSYTYVVPGGDPFMFVYSVGFGWRWVTAPWVYGWGPRPYWGFHGARYYYWHRHPWFHVPRFHPIAPLRFAYHPYYRTHRYYGGSTYYRRSERAPSYYRAGHPAYGGGYHGQARGSGYHGATGYGRGAGGYGHGAGGYGHGAGGYGHGASAPPPPGNYHPAGGPQGHGAGAPPPPSGFHPGGPPHGSRGGHGGHWR